MSADFPPEYFRRQDESDDFVFYQFPRKVVHIDQPAINTLTQAYREILPGDGIYLDLMSSWRSHLPDEWNPERVVGLGMNPLEMQDNPQLDDIDVLNLNAGSDLPYAENQFDGCFCAVSIQYLIEPLRIFQEVNRVLKPGAPFVVSFSNRCFPTKATAVWLNTDDMTHVNLIALYFKESGGWADPSVRIKSAEAGGPPDEDPLYIVWAHKV